MCLWPSVGSQARLIGLEGRPIDEAWMMLGDEHRTLVHRQMAYPLD